MHFSLDSFNQLAEAHLIESVENFHGDTEALRQQEKHL